MKEMDSKNLTPEQGGLIKVIFNAIIDFIVTLTDKK